MKKKMKNLVGIATGILTSLVLLMCPGCGEIIVADETEETTVSTAIEETSEASTNTTSTTNTTTSTSSKSTITTLVKTTKVDLPHFVPSTTITSARAVQMVGCPFVATTTMTTTIKTQTKPKTTTQTTLVAATTSSNTTAATTKKSLTTTTTTTTKTTTTTTTTTTKTETVSSTTRSETVSAAKAAGLNDAEIILLTNLVAREYGANWVPTAEKAKIVAVVMNRVNDSRFPNSITAVIGQRGQFPGYLPTTYYTNKATQDCKDAVNYYFAYRNSFSKSILYYYGDGRWNYFRSSY